MIETNSKLDYRRVSKVMTLITLEFSILLLSMLLEARYFQRGGGGGGGGGVVLTFGWLKRVLHIGTSKNKIAKTERNTF